MAEGLHFGRAAQRLNIVQPAVSQQIRRLERSLGVELFDRSTRRVELTEAGRRFLPQARAVLAAARDAAVAAVGSKQARTLRVGTSGGLGDRLPLLAELDRQHPGLAVELVRLPASARLSQVASGELDAAFVRGDIRHAGLRLAVVWSEEAGHPTWTVYYASEAAVLASHASGVSFRPLTDPVITMSTALALRAGRSQRALIALVAACRAVS